MYDNQYQPAYYDFSYEAEKARVRAEIAASVRIKEAQIKQQMREAADERKRQIGEQLIITPEGELQLQTTNLSVEAKPRKLTNMTNPELIVLYSETEPDTVIYQIDCLVNGKKKSVFLDGTMAGSGTYIKKKFSAAGIYFYLEDAKAKKFCSQFVCILMELSSREVLLPDNEAWAKQADGSYKFVEKGELTWKRAKRLSR